MMSIVQTFVSTGVTMGGGFFLGSLIGYAVKIIKNSCNSWSILSWIKLPIIASDNQCKLE